MQVRTFFRRKRTQHEPIKFPDHDDNGPGEVKTYFLSPEELEKYRSMPKPTGENAKRSMAGIHELKKKKRNEIS